MNKGEVDELKAKLSLIYWRDGNHNGINSVGFYTDNATDFFEYGSHGLMLAEIKNLQNEALIEYCEQCGITKAPSTIKADICINGENISLKSNRGALPALINHTHREGIEKVCNRINLSLQPIDDAIEEYWQQRQAGLITEDVQMCTPNNPFEPIKDYLTTLLAYFLFIGTARADSSIQAERLISFDDPTNYATWTTYSQAEAARQYIDRVTISIRSKAMPTTYIHNGTSDRDKKIAKWTRLSDGSYKGSLHIRG